MTRTALWLFPALALAAPVGPLAAQTVNEPSSGVPFPIHLNAPSGGDQVLMGTGIRTKTFLKVKVYAFGMYVDSAAAREALSGFAGMDLKTLQKDTAFYAALLKLDFPMSLRLVMTRNVDGETMASAFEESLGPRVEHAAADMNMPGGVEALATFRGYFSVEQMTKETELVFTCANGTLYSRVKGEDKPPIESPALCWALFDIYLGAKPISGDGKKSMIANFPALLGSTGGMD
jgi:hypothetical protein